jgi:pimeloyl-ACP methyl ester carboxylesterase
MLPIDQINYTAHGLPMTAVETVSYISESPRPTVIFIHGSPGNWKAWKSFLHMPDLLKNTRMISVNRCGYGPKGNRKAVAELRIQAATLAPLLPDNGNCILVGHSYGGPVAAQLALDYPHLVKGVIMIAGAFDPTLEKHTFLMKFAALKAVRWMVPRMLRVCNEEILPLKTELVKLLSRWKEWKHPMIVLQGDRDPLVPVGNAYFLEKMLQGKSDVEFRILKNQNHFIPWNAKPIVKKSIEDMIEKLSILPNIH